MSEIPSELRYTAEHEWARPGEGNLVRVGITDYAQNSLGDIVFVSIHGVDETVAAGDTVGEVESTKSVSISTLRWPAWWSAATRHWTTIPSC